MIKRELEKDPSLAVRHFCGHGWGRMVAIFALSTCITLVWLFMNRVRRTFSFFISVRGSCHVRQESLDQKHASDT